MRRTGLTRPPRATPLLAAICLVATQGGLAGVAVAGALVEALWRLPGAPLEALGCVGAAALAAVVTAIFGVAVATSSQRGGALLETGH